MVAEIVKNNFLFYCSRLVIRLAWDIVFFPVWWYSRGAALVLVKLGRLIATEEKNLALFVWIKNVFRPMYGVRGWDGYLVSFMVRVFQIIVRSIAIIIWILISIGLFILWLAAPILIISQIFFQLS